MAELVGATGRVSLLSALPGMLTIHNDPAVRHPAGLWHVHTMIARSLWKTYREWHP